MTFCGVHSKNSGIVYPVKLLFQLFIRGGNVPHYGESLFLVLGYVKCLRPPAPLPAPLPARRLTGRRVGLTGQLPARRAYSSERG